VNQPNYYVVKKKKEKEMAKTPQACDYEN